MPNVYMKAFGAKLRLHMVLYVLLKLNKPVIMVIVTNIIYFYNYSVHFSKCFDIVVLIYSVGF